EAFMLSEGFAVGAGGLGGLHWKSGISAPTSRQSARVSTYSSVLFGRIFAIFICGRGIVVVRGVIGVREALFALDRIPEASCSYQRDKGIEHVFWKWDLEELLGDPANQGDKDKKGSDGFP